MGWKVEGRSCGKSRGRGWGLESLPFDYAELRREHAESPSYLDRWQGGIADVEFSHTNTGYKQQANIIIKSVYKNGCMLILL